MAKAEGSIESVVETVGQLNIIGVFGFQERVALLVGQFIEFVQERVEILVRRAVDATAVGQLETVFFIRSVGQSKKKKKIDVFPVEVLSYFSLSEAGQIAQ